MEELGEAYGDRVQIMAFPCNHLGQEPGDAAQIKQFAKDHGFPSDGYLMAKVNVNGPKASEVWKYLKAHARPKPVKSVMWNYEKFLVDAAGEPVKHYGSSFDSRPSPRTSRRSSGRRRGSCTNGGKGEDEWFCMGKPKGTMNGVTTDGT